jgi:glutathione S-transferase
MITLYKYGKLDRIPDLSPFVTKLETYLRMAKIPYQPAGGDHRVAPKKKLPYVGIDGRLLGDSNLIIEHLVAQHGDLLGDDRLAPEQRAVARAFQSMLESDFYFVLAYSRWWRDEDFAIYRPALSAYCASLGLPRLLFPLALGQVRRGMKDQLRQQGIARHSYDEVMAMGRAQLEAISTFLGDKPFFLGERPSALDATAFAMLTGILWAPFESPLKVCALGRPNLAAYCDRMAAAYWSDAPSS